MKEERYKGFTEDKFEKYRVPVSQIEKIVVKPEPKEELYKWYPIVDEGEYWTDYELYPYMQLNPENYKDTHNLDKIITIVTNGKDVWTHPECRLGWGTMAKQGDWKYMRIKID